MSDMMTFPDTWEDFEKSYGFTDNEEVYTNGARLIPSFRVKQWLDHLPSAQPRKGKWTRHFDGNEWYWYCSSCKEQWYEEDLWMGGNSFPNFCPNCGADMREGGEDRQKKKI